MVSAAGENLTFDCIKKSFEEADVVQKQGDNEEPSCDVEEFDGFFWMVVVLIRNSFMAKTILIEIYEMKTLTSMQAVD